LIETNDIEAGRRVIDLSADSANSWSGMSIAEARAQTLAADITINGLAVLCRRCSGRPAAYDLEAAFAELIIGGPASFVITADGATSFAEAVRRKLVLEIAGRLPALAGSGGLGGGLDQRRDLLVHLAEQLVELLGLGLQARNRRIGDVEHPGMTVMADGD
jgi:hypothetical protein